MKYATAAQMFQAESHCLNASNFDFRVSVATIYVARRAERKQEIQGLCCDK